MQGRNKDFWTEEAVDRTQHMPENVYLATPIFCHTAVLYYAKLPLFHGRKILLYHCYLSLKFLI